MKTKIITTIACLFVFSLAFAQNFGKQYYESNSKLGGDVVLKSSEIKIDNDSIVQKIFEIESPANGSYYLDAWLSAPLTPNGYPEYKIAVNNVISPATLKPHTSSWQNVALTNSGKSATTIKLKKGINYVTISGEPFEVPNVEFVKLSSSALNTGISDKKYKDYIDAINTNTNTLNANSLTVLTHTTSISPFAIPEGTNGEVYNYKLDIPVTYTTTYGFANSLDYYFNIKVIPQNNNFEYIIDFFNPTIANKAATSKYCKGTDSLRIKPEIILNIIRLRSYEPGITGIVDLEITHSNGKTSIYKDCPVAGDILNMTGNPSTEHFICSNNNYPVNFYLALGNYVGIITAMGNDTVWSNGKYGSRLTYDLWGSGSGLISAKNSADPVFYADMYLRLKPTPSQILNGFPNISANESFCSGPATTVYNCISWSVGVTNDWFWSNSNSLSYYDALYNSYGYTRTGANADNAAIALWAKDGVIKHASVRKNSTIPKPHGFDWESKCGPQERVMHTRDALAGSTYGSIAYYYRPINGTVNALASLPEATVSTFSSTDMNTIETLNEEIPANIKSEFNKKYAAWKATWNNPKIAFESNPRKYAESDEYTALSQFCQQHGKITWPLFIQKLSDGDVFVCNLLEDLTFPTKENKALYNEAISVKTRAIGIPSPFIYSNMVEYSKRLLNKENINIKNSIRNRANADISVPNVNITAENGNILLNLHLETATTITVHVYDVYGSSIYSANYAVPNGAWNTTVNNSDFKNGTYIVRITMNGKTISQKITI